ncbi:MAG: hypothetical protein NVS1B11_36970 [Terriglobales bacterium]
MKEYKPRAESKLGKLVQEIQDMDYSRVVLDRKLSQLHAEMEMLDSQRDQVIAQIEIERDRKEPRRHTKKAA